jgi:hypothetical protein
VFQLLLLAVVLAAAVQFVRSTPRNRERAGTLLLLWVLVGYCGLPMIAVAVVNLARPDVTAGLLGFATGSPFQSFFGWAYLGMATAATLSALYRGTFLIGPAVLWAIFFAGATWIHLSDMAGGGEVTHGGAIAIFTAHGLVSLILVGGLVASGVLRARQ